MRAFGSLRIASLLALLFFSLAASMPSKMAGNDDDYPGDGQDDYDDEPGDGDDQPSQDDKPSAPVILRSHSMVVEARPGDTVELQCLVDNGDGIIINWLKGDEMIFADTAPVNHDDTRFTRAENYSLIIRNVTEKDTSDRWHCQLLMDPPKELYHTLRIVEKPRELWGGIHVTPSRHVEVTENDTITLGCETNHQPKREVKWSKGERLHNNDNTVIEGNTITLKRVTMHNAGRYQCLIEDNSENPPTDSIEVVVKYAPHIDVERQIVHTGIGRTSELTCIVHAHPHAKITWHKDNRKIVTEDENKIRVVENKAHRTLVIERTTKGDLGEYTCKAKNKFGETSKNVILTGAPSRPRLHGGEVPDDEPTLILKWQTETFAPLIEYKLEYRMKDEKEWKVASPPVTDGSGNQFTLEYPLEHLQAGSYEARLMARNVYGWSQYSDIHTFRQGYKPERAENVKDSGASSTRMALAALLLVVMTSYQSSWL